MEEPGPALLRAFRTRAGLTQDALAEAAGVHVRTVRGLELGRIVSPRRTSIDLLAHALGLDVGDDLRLRIAWGFVDDDAPSGSRSPSRAGGPVPHRDRVEVVEDHLHASNASLRKVVLNERILVGADRHVIRRVTQEVVLATADDVSTHAVFYEPMDPSVAVDDLTLTDLENCRVDKVIRDPAGSAALFVLGLGRTLARGETHVLHYTADFAAARSAAPSARPGSGEEIVGFVHPPTSCVLEVVFAEDALPVACRRIFQSRPTTPFRTVGPLELDATHTVHLALVNPKPGGHGIGWSWDDDRTVGSAPPRA